MVTIALFSDFKTYFMIFNEYPDPPGTHLKQQKCQSLPLKLTTKHKKIYTIFSRALNISKLVNITNF